MELDFGLNCLLIDFRGYLIIVVYPEVIQWWKIDVKQKNTPIYLSALALPLLSFARKLFG